MLMAGCTTANEETSRQSSPPARYPLESVKISIHYHPARQLPGGYKINITGNGKGTYITEKGEKTITLQDKTIVELLNGF